MIVKCEILTPSFTEIEITETMIKELYNKFRDNNKVLDTIVEYIQEEVGGYCNIQEIENYINEVIKKIGASKKVVDNKKYLWYNIIRKIGKELLIWY